MRVRHRSHVEEKIGIEGYPVLVAEAGEVNGDRGIAAQHLVHQPIAQLAGREVARINNGIGSLT